MNATKKRRISDNPKKWYWLSRIKRNAEHIHKQLGEDGLPTLAEALFKNNAVIAGSYTLQPRSVPTNPYLPKKASVFAMAERTRDDLMDIDIWIPFSAQRTQHAKALLVCICA
jgi:hypothetical protein